MGKEGDRDGRWVLLDYGDFVVHVFHSPVRDYYELDRLYADADKVPLEEPEWLAQAERERLYANTADWSDDSVEQIDANWEEQESSPADEENASADP
jgi:ribosome-associated protein